MEQLSRDGLVLDVSGSGPVDGQTVVLLHGWPQDRHAWDAVTPLLTDQALRVVAPDQRGYSPLARPQGRSAYRMAELVADVLALVDALGKDRVHLVGHDWGGAVAWAFAERHPQRLASLVVLSTPHHAALAWASRHGDQALRSAYVAAFQLPYLPELLLRPTLERLLTTSGLPADRAARYADRFREPGTASATLAWYRALPLAGEAVAAVRGALRPLTGTSPSPRPGPHPMIQVPTTYLWGSRDPALGRAAAERTSRYVDADYDFVELEAGHWLPETRPQQVAEAIARRVAATPPGR